MIDWVKFIHLWLRVVKNVVHLVAHFSDGIEEIYDRIETLEYLVFKGNIAYLINVPEGMSPEVAWENYSSGEEFIGKDTRKCLVLVDSMGNILKVVE